MLTHYERLYSAIIIFFLKVKRLISSAHTISKIKIKILITANKQMHKLECNTYIDNGPYIHS